MPYLHDYVQHDGLVELRWEDPLPVDVSACQSMSQAGLCQSILGQLIPRHSIPHHPVTRH